MKKSQDWRGCLSSIFWSSPFSPSKFKFVVVDFYRLLCMDFLLLLKKRYGHPSVSMRRDKSWHWNTNSLGNPENNCFFWSLHFWINEQVNGSTRTFNSCSFCDSAGETTLDKKGWVCFHQRRYSSCFSQIMETFATLQDVLRNEIVLIPSPFFCFDVSIVTAGTLMIIFTASSTRPTTSFFSHWECKLQTFECSRFESWWYSMWIDVTKSPPANWKKVTWIHESWVGPRCVPRDSKKKFHLDKVRLKPHAGIGFS